MARNKIEMGKMAGLGMEEDPMLQQIKLFESLVLRMVDDPEGMQSAFDQNYREVKEEFAPLNSVLDKAVAQTSDPEYIAAHIHKCNEQYFPGIVIEQVEKLLFVSSSNDIFRVRNLLNQIKCNGISAIWDTIKDDVTKNARRICGNVFPDEYIDSGKNITLDITRLENIVDEHINNYNSCRKTTTGRDTISRSAFSGFRRGFLSAKPPEPERDDVAYQKNTNI